MSITVTPITPSFVAETVTSLLNDAGRLQAMTAAAALAGHRDAALRVAEVALDVARGSRNERKRLR